MHRVADDSQKTDQDTVCLKVDEEIIFAIATLAKVYYQLHDMLYRCTHFIKLALKMLLEEQKKS